MSSGYYYSTRRAAEILRENQTRLRSRVETVQKLLDELTQCECADFIRDEIVELQQQINSAAAKITIPQQGFDLLSNFSTAEAKRIGTERKRQHDQLMQERAELQQRYEALSKQLAQTELRLQVFNPQAYAQIQAQALQVVSQNQEHPTAGYSELERLTEQLTALNAKHQILVNHGEQTRKTFAQWQAAGVHPAELESYFTEVQEIMSSEGDITGKLNQLTQMQAQARTQVRHQLIGTQLAEQAEQESAQFQKSELERFERLAHQLRQREAVRARWQQAMANWGDKMLEARCRPELLKLMEASVAAYDTFSEAQMQEQIAAVRQHHQAQLDQELQELRAEEQRLAEATAREVELEELRRLERANAQAERPAEELSLEELRKLRQQAQKEYELRFERERLENERRQTVGAIYNSIQELGFDIDDPILTPQGEVLLRGRRNQGPLAQVMVHLDGRLAIKLDNYDEQELEKCEADIDKVTQILADVYGIQTEKTASFYSDPRRIKKAAKKLPTSSQTQHQTYRSSSR